MSNQADTIVLAMNGIALLLSNLSFVTESSWSHFTACTSRFDSIIPLARPTIYIVNVIPHLHNFFNAIFMLNFQILQLLC